MAQTMTGRVWREQPQRYRMIASKDKKSGEVYFPPRRVAPGDLNPKFEEVSLMEGVARVLTYTIIRVPPAPFSDLAPYALAIIRTEEGARLTVQIVDLPLEKVKIGMRVRFEFRRIFEDNDASVIYYGYKAVPV